MVIDMEELKIDNLVYAPYKKGIDIKRYQGSDKQLNIPAEIGEKPVISIDKKAFLSCKSIREISLPDSIEEIGDWAFAHAENLRTITLPRKEISRGKELFLGCKRLRSIELNNLPIELRDKGLGRMLALGVTILHDYSLFAPMEVGADWWVKHWDDKLMALIELDDLDGFEELWTCGEEDYEGKDYDIKSYPVEKRKMKLRVVYFRLLNPYKLENDRKSALQAYVRGAKEAWEIIINEHRNELEYYKAFTEAKAATEENFESLITSLDNVSPEIKAYMLRYKDENLEKKDAFSEFELDW
jgi:hypothetical protein